MPILNQTLIPLAVEAKNKEIEVKVSGGKRYTVTLPRNRKTPGELTLDPPAETHKVKLTILSVYSQSHNGLALVQLWEAVTTRDLKRQRPDYHYLPSPAREAGIWGPWEMCPKGEKVVSWRAKWSKELGITGKIRPLAGKKCHEENALIKACLWRPLVSFCCHISRMGESCLVCVHILCTIPFQKTFLMMMSPLGLSNSF